MDRLFDGGCRIQGGFKNSAIDYDIVGGRRTPPWRPVGAIRPVGAGPADPLFDE